MLIFKETLPIKNEEVVITMPYNSVADAVKSIMCVNLQGSDPQMWYQVDGDGAGESNAFTIVAVGTGNKVGGVSKEGYIGTVVFSRRKVLHYFISMGAKQVEDAKTVVKADDEIDGNTIVKAVLDDYAKIINKDYNISDKINKELKDEDGWVK